MSVDEQVDATKPLKVLAWLLIACSVATVTALIVATLVFGLVSTFTFVSLVLSAAFWWVRYEIRIAHDAPSPVLEEVREAEGVLNLEDLEQEWGGSSRAAS